MLNQKCRKSGKSKFCFINWCEEVGMLFINGVCMHFYVKWISDPSVSISFDNELNKAID
jgi:hypothetical protein